MQEAQEIELLPCPFCSGKAEWDDWYAYDCDMFQIKCTKCLATSCTGVINERNLIAELWNKRLYEKFFEEIKHHADNGHEAISVKWLLNEIKKLYE